MSKPDRYFEQTEVTIAEVTTIQRVIAPDLETATKMFDAGEGMVITSVPGNVLSVKHTDIEEVPL